MSKHHTPLIDDFVNELLGDENELSDAANQDHAGSMEVHTDQTLTSEKTEVETVEETTRPATTPVEIEIADTDASPEPAAQASTEVEAIEETSNPAPTSAEIEASTVVEGITLDDYARATAVIENFKANVESPETIHTATTGPSDQISTQAESEVQAVEELSVANHSQEKAPEPDDIAASVAVDFDEEPPQETTLTNSKADTEQTTTATDSEEPATTESRDNIDPDAIAASVIADFDAEFPTTAADDAASAPSPEETSPEAPDADAIAASVIADFDAEFPTQDDTASDVDTEEVSAVAAPEPDDIAASVIADFEKEFPTESGTPENTAVETENTAQPTAEPDDIAATVIADFDAEFPVEPDAASAAPAPDAMAASVIEDFEAEFPTEPEPSDATTATTSPVDDKTEPAVPAEPAPSTEQNGDAPGEDQFRQDLERWMQPPAVVEEEVTVDYSLRCVSFTLQGQTYATEVQTLLEVLEHADIVPIPSMSHPILGIFNLRGNIVPVVDPSLLLGLPPTDASDKQLLVAEYRSGAVALPISTVSEVVNIEQNAIQKAPQASAHIIGLAPVHDEMLTLLDLAKLISKTLGDHQRID